MDIGEHLRKLDEAIANLEEYQALKEAAALRKREQSRAWYLRTREVRIRRALDNRLLNPERYAAYAAVSQERRRNPDFVPRNYERVDDEAH